MCVFNNATCMSNSSAIFGELHYKLTGPIPLQMSVAMEGNFA